MPLIDSRAIVDPSADIDSQVEIGPWSLIGPGVKIGAGTQIGPHVVIKGPTEIGCHNRIFQFASIGEECQDKKYQGEPTRLVIGDHNVIREGCTLHRGTVQDEGVTRIGSHNLLMAYVHIAHDCVLGDRIIMANNTAVAGHVHVSDWAILGGATLVHQFCKIGAHSMSGAGTVILKDVPAYVMVSGNTAVPHGINAEGLKRRDFSAAAIQNIRRAYKLIYRQAKPVAEVAEELASWAADAPELQPLLLSLQQSSRGIVR